jgi:acetyltransferase-like isoleucine patch superfamily enzyme
MNRLILIISEVLFIIRLAMSGPYKKIEIYKKKMGISAGKNIRITGNVVFGTEPYLIELGNDITITRNVMFHTHDGGVWVFRKDYPDINIYRRIKVGNNVFFGANSSIMPGVTIGDNVVIAANSVVTKDCESDSVYAGVPARKIRELKDYKEKVLLEAVYIKSSDPEERKKEILEQLEKKK